jgi:hypothetical protein
MQILSFQNRILDLYGLDREEEAKSLIKSIISGVDESVMRDNKQTLIASTNMDLIAEALNGKMQDGVKYVFLYAWKNVDGGRIALFESQPSPTLAGGVFVNDFIYKNKIYNGFIFHF